MYRQFISQADYDRIVNNDHVDDPDIFPHCNTETFHEPGTCPYCDSYFRRHPGFTPAVYATREANGWGGNQAPILDDVKAAEEQQAWDAMVAEFVDGTYEKKEKKRIQDRFDAIIARFRK